MITRLIMPGQREPVARDAARGAVAGGVPAPPVTGLLDAVEVVETFNLSPAARGRTAVPQVFEARDDDILQIEIEGGVTLWTSAPRHRAQVERLRPEAVAADGSLAMDAVPRASVTERGITQWLPSALTVLRLGR